MQKKILHIIAAISLLFTLSYSDACASYPDSVSAISVGNSPTSCALAGGYLFVTNSLDNTVSAIDLATKAIQTIDVGNNPWHVVSDASGNYIYVSNYNDDSISVISVTSLSVTETVTGVGDAPYGMCVSPSGSKLYVACRESDSVVIISTIDNTIDTEITAVGDLPSFAAVSLSGNYLYVTLEGDDSVALVDLTSNTVSSTKIAVGNSPTGAAVTPNGSYLYVANSGSDSVSVISLSSNSVINTIDNVGDGVREIAILPNGEYAFVTNSNSDTVTILNILDDTVEKTVSTGSSPHGVSASDDGKFVYVTNMDDNIVSVIQDVTIVVIDEVDNQWINDSGAATIKWHTSENGAYQVEVGGEGIKGSGDVIATGDATASVQNETSIVAATHLSGKDDGTYKIYFYLTTDTGEEYSNSTTVVLDNAAPSAPTGVAAEFGDAKLYLSWDASSESDLASYKVYYATAPGSYDNNVDVGLRSSYELEGLTNGVTYYIAVVAVDLAGNESDYSVEISETPDKVLSLSGLKGEEGCFVATASYTKNIAKKNNILEIIRALVTFK